MRLWITQDARAWSQAGGEHKMGWVRKGDLVEVVDSYAQHWKQIVPVDIELDGHENCADLLPPHNPSEEPQIAPFDYTDYWVRDDEVGFSVSNPLDPVNDPNADTQPTPAAVTYEDVGLAVRTLVEFIKGVWNNGTS